MRFKPLLATAALLAGAGVGAFVFAPTLANAQDGDTDAGVQTEEVEPTEEVEERGRTRLAEVLQGLVDDGVIDEAQAQAVEDAIVEAAPDRRGHRHRGPGRLDAAAEAIGIERDELVEALRAGQTLAEIAEENDVDPQSLIDALVAEADARIDEKVEEGRIDAEQADEARSRAAARIEAMVDGELGPRDGDGFGGRGRPGRFLPGEGRFGPPDADDPQGA